MLYSVYRDDRGWTYMVRGGIGQQDFKAFYNKTGKYGWHGCRALPWRKTYEEAQKDLDDYAEKKGWKRAR